MLHEFDQYLDDCYLGKKARKNLWCWNHSIKIGRKLAVEQNRKCKPAVAYCRYANDFVMIIKAGKKEAEAIRDQCCKFLENILKLTLNMDKTHIRHVNGGFVFLVTGSFASVDLKAICE